MSGREKGFPRAGGVRERVLGLLTLRGTVTEAEPVAARMRRIRIAGSGLAGLTVLPGQQIRVHVDGGLTTRRTYSLRWYDPAGSLDLCVYDHGDGPGAAWGRSVRVGDEVRFGKPEGGFVLRPGASHHVFVGEETASVALAAMLAALPDPSRVHGVIQTATEAGRLPVDHAGRLRWQLRGDRPAAASQQLADGVRALELPAPQGAVAYVAGEARTVQLVRGVLVGERGWPRRSVVTKPFWTPGRRGLE